MTETPAWLSGVPRYQRSHGGIYRKESIVPPSQAEEWVKLADVLDAVKHHQEALEVLYSTLVPFNEGKQEFFCRVCRYRDPLVNGTKLHDDNCPLYALFAKGEGVTSA